MTCTTITVSSCSSSPKKLNMDTISSNSDCILPLSPKNIKDESHNQLVLKPSDFSIDHILNRAGKCLDAKKPQSKQHFHQPADGDLIYLNSSDDRLIFADTICESQSLPIFNWLQYTRYRPPRPQSMYITISPNKFTTTYSQTIHTENAQHKPAKRTPGRLPRVPFSTHQLSVLEDAYKQSSYLSAEEANRLADTLELTSTRVKIWFQNRRARERRERREAEMTASNVGSSGALPTVPDEVCSSTSRTSSTRNGSLNAIIGYHNYLDLCTQQTISHRIRPY